MWISFTSDKQPLFQSRAILHLFSVKLILAIPNSPLTKSLEPKSNVITLGAVTLDTLFELTLFLLHFFHHTLHCHHSHHHLN